MLKITNLGKGRRRLIDKGGWVWFGPKESVIIDHIDQSQLFIKDSKIFKIEEVSESEAKKSKKGDQ